MKCIEIEKQIDSFVADELNFAEKRKINLHLQDCADCREEIKEIQETRSLLKALPAIPVSNQFDARIMQAFRERHQEKAKPAFWEALVSGFSISKPALALGLLAIAVFTGFAFQIGRMTAPKPGNSEISVNNQSEQKSEPLVQIVEKRIEVPVIKTVEVPVYKERIVNRVIYKDREITKRIRDFNENLNRITNDSYNSQNMDVTDFMKNGETLTQINLKEFRPLIEIKAEVTRKEDINEK